MRWAKWLLNGITPMLGAVLVCMPVYPMLRWDAPQVTIYMPDDCSSCAAWRSYLREKGFRTRRGTSAEWTALRARFRLPAAFRSQHSAEVEGLLLEGHVPAEVIRGVLAKPEHGHVRGLAVPGVPSGAPGLFSFAPQPYHVYAVMDSGLIRTVGQYQHFH